MTYLPRFAYPWMLLFLVLVPWSVYAGVKIRSLARGRKWTAIVLRTVILLCLVAALAGMEMVKRSDRLAVFFLLDQSNSIAEELRRSSAQWVRNICEQFMTSKDEAGVIVFGEDASVELNVAPTLGMREVRSYVGGDQTDLAAAMRLATAAFPQGYMRRMVVFSDGNETRGKALEEAKLAHAEGIAVDVIPLDTGGTQEVRVREVTAPTQANADEPFQLRIVVSAEQACGGTLQVYQRLGKQRRMMAPQEVPLQRGDNVFLLTQELGSAGFYEYEVSIASDADTVSENNMGRAFTTVHGEPTVLYVEGNPEHSTYLEAALIAEGLRVVRMEPAGLPSSLAGMQGFDSVVLSDVSAARLSSEQLSLIEAMVRDHGIGLVMIGGPESFGAGGYLDTPVERTLPVDMDIKQRKILPRGALAVVMHTCEIQDGNVWAREIALAALNVLASQDLMGALGYLHNSGDTWLFDLQPVGDKTQMRRTITRASTQIGDMPATGPTLQMAFDALQDAHAAVKRVILISDGDPAAPSNSLLRKYAAAKIPISTVSIATHSINDKNMLSNVARATGGQYYDVVNPQNLPQIFSKEAAVVKRGVLIEKEFTPQALHDSELLFGLAGATIPPLRGYVVTVPKDNATIPLVSHEGDPVLAHWRFGLGKAAAFTSDVTNRWAADWVGWEGFNRFWAQTVRWTLREIAPTNFRIETRLQDGQGYVRVDAVDESGKFINFLRPKGVVTTPAYDRTDLDLEQTGPGIYEGVFPVRGSGVYLINLTYQREDGSTGMIPAGLAVDYSREYEYHTTNLPLLENAALTGGGRLLQAEENPFRHDLVASPTITPMWPWLALVALCLFPFEIFVRRVVVPVGAVVEVVWRMLRWLPGLKRLIPKPAKRRVVATGTYSSGVARTHDFGTGAPAAESFGQVVTAAPLAARTGVPEGDAGETPTKPAGHTDYTQQLLAAKERALSKTRGARGGKDS